MVIIDADIAVDIVMAILWYDKLLRSLFDSSITINDIVGFVAFVSKLFWRESGQFVDFGVNFLCNVYLSSYFLF